MTLSKKLHRLLRATYEYEGIINQEYHCIMVKRSGTFCIYFNDYCLHATNGDHSGVNLTRFKWDMRDSYLPTNYQNIVVYENAELDKYLDIMIRAIDEQIMVWKCTMDSERFRDLIV